MRDVHLTEREREVVEHVVRGLSDKEIARRLGISRETVRTHIENAAMKLPGARHARPRPKLYSWWLRQLEREVRLPENGDGETSHAVANVG